MQAIKNVLISVTDKTGIDEFARRLSQDFGVRLISTGGTARTLAEAGLEVVPVEEVTQFPEMMDGRVKTLHPAIHGGLLARRDKQEHMDAATSLGIGMIDMVVVNLYEFSKTVSQGSDFAACVEKIDIGGPAMLRSAAKNFEFVTVVADPADYERVLADMQAHDGATSLELRRDLALRVFETTARYDAAIARYLHRNTTEATDFGKGALIDLIKVQDLRYGENPHQHAAFYARHDYLGFCHSLAAATQHQGKELSYNNYLDLDAAWTAVREFGPETPACVIVKHLTPCGIALGRDARDAYAAAFAGDPISAFGGVIAFNCPINAEVAQAIFENNHFVEAIVAPEMAQDFLSMYECKPNCRLLTTGGVNPAGNETEYRSVEGGILVQEADAVRIGKDDLSFPTIKKPTDEDLEELLFAWRACKSVKSNAIVISKDKALLAAGGGQTNRVMAARIAVKNAAANAQGAYAASDAFFPFRDGLDVLAQAGVKAVIQPGGSIRDEEVIKACDEQGICMVFTHQRHFRH